MSYFKDDDSYKIEIKEYSNFDKKKVIKCKNSKNENIQNIMLN